MKRRRWFTRFGALPALVALIALTISGCGSSGSSSNSTPPTLSAACAVNSASLNDTLRIQCAALWSDDSAFAGTFNLTAPADTDFPGSNSMILIDATGLVTSSAALASGDEGTKTLTVIATADNGVEATVSNQFDVDTRKVTMTVDQGTPALFPKAQADTISANCGVGFDQLSADAFDYDFTVDDVACMDAAVAALSQTEQDKLMLYLPTGTSFAVFFDAATATSVTFNWTAGQPLPSGPALTAAATAAVEADFAITFTDADGWAAALTKLSVDGTELAAADFTVDGANGTLTLHPTNPTPNQLLTTSGTKIITAFATGFAPNSVSQAIGAGAPVVANATSVITPPLAAGALSTVTVSARDQFGNVAATAIDPLFVVDTTTADIGPTAESYSVAGTVVTLGNDPLNSPLTSAGGIASFEISVPAVLDPDDGITVQVKAADQVTNIEAPFTFFGAPALIAAAAVNATVDAPVDITFSNANGWAEAVSASGTISVGPTALLPADFNIDPVAGTLSLLPANGNLAIVTSNNTIAKVVTVSAPGFTDATVDQIIGHGLVDPTRSKVRNANLGSGETTAVTVEAFDQFDNLATTAAHIFFVDATITNAGAVDNYVIAGDTETVTFTGKQLNATLTNGETAFNVTVPSTVEAGDSISIQVRLDDGGALVDKAIDLFN